MNRKIRYIITFLLGLVAFFGLSSSVDARSLKIDKYDITVNILENGDVQFKEKITFNADGSYNGVFYNLEYKGFLHPIDVAAFIESAQGDIEIPRNASGQNGSYQLSNDGNKMNFKVFMPFSNTTRTVTFQYTIPKMITNYEDTAELNRKVVGKEWEINQENITVTVNLPGNASRETLRAWGHGAGKNGEVKIAEDYKSVTFTAPSNESGDFVEVHVLFPQTLTPFNTNIVSEKAFERIVAEEEELILRDERLKSMGAMGIYVTWGLMVLNLIFAWVKGFFANRKRLSQVPHIPDHHYELPEDISPAIMNQAVYQECSMLDLSATIMDLIRKKVLTLTDTKPYILKLVGEVSGLLPHEKIAIEFLFEDVGEGRHYIYLMEDIQRFAKKEPEKYLKSTAAWMASVETSSRKYRVDLFKKGEAEARNIFSGCAIFLLVFVGIMIGIFTDNGSLSMYTLLISLLFIPLTWIGSGVTAPRRSLEGEYRYRKWQAFKRMLWDISPMSRVEDLPSIQIWDHFLVYAISLGVAENLIKILKKIIPDQLSQSVFYSEHMGTLYNPVPKLDEVLSTSFHLAGTRVPSSSSSSNSGGFGGGFSGGSSGGSGGGSGGGGF